MTYLQFYILDNSAMSLVEPEIDEASYQQCLNWIKNQSEDFRSRLMKDLAEWEQLQRQSSDVPYISAPSSPTAGSKTDPEVLTAEVKNTDWGPVTEYIRPVSGPFKFRGPDGIVRTHDPKKVSHFHHPMPNKLYSVWYYVGCRNCRRFAVTFPDNGGSWSHAMRQLGWRGKKWANMYCHQCG